MTFHGQTTFEHEPVFDRLLRIPGVVRVGYGLRESGGALVEEYAYRVYVQRKKPRAHLSIRERIPSHVDGMLTDVVVLPGKPVPYCSSNLQPGHRVTRDVPNDPSELGTIGLFVKQDGNQYLLTCKHVLTDNKFLHDATFPNVYSPAKRSCVGFVCNDPIAKWAPDKSFEGSYAADGQNYWIDAAIAPLEPKVSVSNRIEGVAPLIPGLDGLRDLRGAPLIPKILVRKRGATTSIQTGAVAELQHKHLDGVTYSEILVVPELGQEYDETFELVEGSNRIRELLESYTNDPNAKVQVASHSTSDGITKLRLKGRVFSLPGDSGSVVVDSFGKIVGLLYAGGSEQVSVKGSTTPRTLPHGNTLVQHVFPMFQKLNLDPATAVIPPGAPAAGMRVEWSDTELEAGRDQYQDTAAAFEQLQINLAQTATGRLLLDLAKRHLRQIQVLIREQRQVAVAWHRSMAQAFSAALVKSWRDNSIALPATLGGVSADEAYRRFGEVLAAKGSPDLKDSVSRHGPFLIRLVSACAGHSNLLGSLDELGETLS